MRSKMNSILRLQIQHKHSELGSYDSSPKKQNLLSKKSNILE